MIHSATSKASNSWSNEAAKVLQCVPKNDAGSAGHRIERARPFPTIHGETIAARDALALCMLESALGG